MNEPSPQQGIDFFDFLFAIWRFKWMFVAIVAVCTLAAVGLSMARHKEEAPREVTGTTARFAVVMRTGNDPLLRGGSALLADLVHFVDKDNALDLEFAGLVSADNIQFAKITAEAKRSYSIEFTGGQNVGWVDLNIKDGDDSAYKAIHAEFQRAAEQQFKEAVATARASVQAIVPSANAQTGGSGSVVALSDRIAASIQFLGTPEVMDGSWRFFQFKPLILKTSVSRLSVEATSFVKQSVLGALIGFVLACVAIMFRIAIQRHSKLSAV